jgi:hypothetical protein
MCDGTVTHYVRIEGKLLDEEVGQLDCLNHQCKRTALVVDSKYVSDCSSKAVIFLAQLADLGNGKRPFSTFTLKL